MMSAGRKIRVIFHDQHLRSVCPGAPVTPPPGSAGVWSITQSSFSVRPPFIFDVNQIRNGGIHLWFPAKPGTLADAAKQKVRGWVLNRHQT
jgi:hypothetical protein